MKAVMVSIRPKWVEKIASGEKTIEVRKSVPKTDEPFKVYMYCTNDRKEVLCVAEGGLAKKGDLYINGNIHYPFTGGTLNGKVVGEFVCDDLFYFIQFDMGIFACKIEDGKVLPPDTNPFSKTFLSEKEMEEYLGCKDGYGWHISDLKIYDKPKEITDFEYPCPRPSGGYNCYGCKYQEQISANKYGCNARVHRPPQSWCYVEEI